MTEVERQIKEILKKYSYKGYNNASDMLEADLMILVAFAERDQMIKDHEETLKILQG